MRPGVMAILGPTAVGKTAISIRLAESLDGEVISVDSRTIYKGMDIGTAKPTALEQARVPHHLIDVADPAAPWSLTTFTQAALRVIGEVHQRGHLPLLVGGTGQYLTAILEGWSPPPKSEDPALRQKLNDFAEEHGSEALHQRLAEVDPISGDRIDHRNIRRVVRALEIYYLRGEPPSRLRERVEPSFRVLRVGLTLPRTELFRRIDARIDAMLAAGFVDEVAGLLASGIPSDSPALTAIGYRQIAEHIQGKITLSEAIEKMRRLTRQFVRRQANWFKTDDPLIHWFTVRSAVEEEIERIVRAWLAETEKFTEGEKD